MPKRHQGPIRVGDLTPELIDAVELTRDGETVVLRGYVNGTRCPGRVKAECASATNRYSAVVRADDGTFTHDPAAYVEYCRSTLLAVVLGLEDTEADVLSGDDDRIGEVLRRLDWWAGDDADEDDADPEAKGEGSPTSETSSPGSPPATGSDPESS